MHHRASIRTSLSEPSGTNYSTIAVPADGVVRDGKIKEAWNKSRGNMARSFASLWAFSVMSVGQRISDYFELSNSTTGECMDLLLVYEPLFTRGEETMLMAFH